MNNQYQKLRTMTEDLGVRSPIPTDPQTAYRTPKGKVIHRHESCRLLRSDEPVSLTVNPSDPGAALPPKGQACRMCWERVPVSVRPFVEDLTRLHRVHLEHTVLLEDKPPWEHFAEHARYAQVLNRLVPSLEDADVAQGALALAAKAEANAISLREQAGDEALEPLLQRVAGEITPPVSLEGPEIEYLFARSNSMLANAIGREITAGLEKGRGIDQAAKAGIEAASHFLERGPQDLSQLPDQADVHCGLTPKQAVVAQWRSAVSAAIEEAVESYRASMLDTVERYGGHGDAVLLLQRVEPQGRVYMGLSWLLAPFGLKYCQSDTTTALVKVPAIVAAMFSDRGERMRYSTLTRCIGETRALVFVNADVTDAQLEAIATLYEPDVDTNVVRAELALLLSNAQALV